MLSVTVRQLGGRAPGFAHTAVARSTEEILSLPKPSITSLPFVPPPRWAALVPARLEKAFPSFPRQRGVLFLKALIHPSYTTESAADGTMSSLCPIGQAVLTHSVQCAIANAAARPGGANLNPKRLAQDICTEEALSAVMKGGWGLEDMILTDAVIREIRDARTSKGLLQISSSRTAIPIGYHRQCVQALIGAIYLDSGLCVAMRFINTHVIPLAIEYLVLQ
jgi:dsRNA-specific ribonuclease